MFLKNAIVWFFLKSDMIGRLFKEDLLKPLKRCFVSSSSCAIISFSGIEGKRSPSCSRTAFEGVTDLEHL